MFAAWIVYENAVYRSPTGSEHDSTFVKPSSREFLSELERKFPHESTTVTRNSLLGMIAQQGLEAEEVCKDAIALLRATRPETRVEAIHFLARLQDSWALYADGLNDEDPRVRIAVCYAIRDIGPMKSLSSGMLGTQTERRLPELRDSDPLFEVRFAAAIALQSLGQADFKTVALLWQGLAYDNPRIREQSEAALERLKLLLLPLNERLYEDIALVEYQKLKASLGSNDKIEREARKNGKLYFEHVFQDSDGQRGRRWYRTEDSNPKMARPQ
jgi:HEAT repeats